ncbi:MAG: type II toxin-antitoxin system RelE/ParE family toxin [Candidatus Margulisbacteria bacterium]|nr:type II toxin-antitoxin system RelE/ParE family toxin [Candidatus Margulisiibacteriota bacterium]
MPFAYELFFTHQAKKELAKIRKGNPSIARLITDHLNQLQFDPHIGVPLHGDLKGRMKLRVGNYRIIYTIEKNKLIIYVLTVAHRKDVYR